MIAAIGQAGCCYVDLVRQPHVAQAAWRSFTACSSGSFASTIGALSECFSTANNCFSSAFINFELLARFPSLQYPYCVLETQQKQLSHTGSLQPICTGSEARALQLHYKYHTA